VSAEGVKKSNWTSEALLLPPLGCWAVDFWQPEHYSKLVLFCLQLLVQVRQIRVPNFCGDFIPLLGELEGIFFAVFERKVDTCYSSYEHVDEQVKPTVWPFFRIRFEGEKKTQSRTCKEAQENTTHYQASLMISSEIPLTGLWSSSLHLRPGSMFLQPRTEYRLFLMMWMEWKKHSHTQKEEKEYQDAYPVISLTLQWGRQLGYTPCSAS
jgi:hypothetical protein